MSGNPTTQGLTFAVVRADLEIAFRVFGERCQRASDLGQWMLRELLTITIIVRHKTQKTGPGERAVSVKIGRFHELSHICSLLNLVLQFFKPFRRYAAIYRNYFGDIRRAVAQCCFGARQPRRVIGGAAKERFGCSYAKVGGGSKGQGLDARSDGVVGFQLVV